MKADIIDLENNQIAKIDMPNQFNEPVRPDLIKRAVLALQSKKRCQYGAYSRAGKGYSVRISKRRRDYRGSYGIGIARTPRKVMSRRGTRMNWVGAFAPNTVGGRRAHPPKSIKIWEQKINIKEKRKAIRSALASVISKVSIIAILQRYPLPLHLSHPTGSGIFPLNSILYF